MASSGSIVSDFHSGNYSTVISWVVNSQNIANNTSNVTVSAQLRSNSSYYSINSSATKNGSLTINGTTYNFTFSADLNANQTKTVYTKTVDIPHNSDGNKTCSMSTSLGIAVTLSGTYYSSVSASGSCVFNLIPRASSFTLSASSVTLGSTQQTVTITRASTSFDHKITYKIGTNSWVKASDVATSYSFTPPKTDCNYVTTSTSATATIVVDTYNGATLIGTSSKTFTITVPSDVKPTLTSLSASVVASGASTSYGYVQGKSKAQLTINGGSGAYGSTIKSYSISGGGFSGTTTPYTTGVLNTSGSITFTATVTDSRGRVSDAKTVSITVQPYSIPSISSFTALRCLVDGVANNEGTYVKASSTHTYSTIGGLNSLTTLVEYRQTGVGTWTSGGTITSGTPKTIGGGLIDIGLTYEVKLTITDNFTSTSKTVIVSTSFVTMDFKNGGKGVAIGKMSETENLFEVAMLTRIKGNSMLLSLDSSTHAYAQFTKDGVRKGWVGLGSTLNENASFYADNGTCNLISKNNAVYLISFDGDSGSKKSVGLWATAFCPDAIYTNTINLGIGGQVWKQLFAGNTTISTSDRNYKQQITSLEDILLDAWSEVEYCKFKFNDAVAEKGESARWHTGVIAQEIEEAFKRHGLDAFEYGLLCFDEWEDSFDEEGNLVRPKGQMYSIRADECQFLEMALQRRETERLKQQINELKGI